MEKIPTLFQRNYETDRMVRDEVVPGCQWVLAGEGVATRKFDGACTMVKNAVFFNRYELKSGKIAPENFVPADTDPLNGNVVGWVPVMNKPEDEWFRVEITNSEYNDGGQPKFLADGTYEACGPHFQGNPEGFLVDSLVRHGQDVLALVPRDFLGLRSYLAAVNVEGIVFWHPDGRMAKIKTRDYGFKRVKPC